MNKLNHATSFHRVPDLVNKHNKEHFELNGNLNRTAWINHYFSIGYGHIEFNNLPSITTITHGFARYYSTSSKPKHSQHGEVLE